MMRRLQSLFLFSLLAIALNSCGYRWGNSCLGSQCRSLTLCYIGGDQEGFLTSALVRELSSNGSFYYKRSGGELLLKVEILNVADAPVGYRFDRDRNEEVNQRIITAEGRLQIVARVSLRDCRNACCLISPTRVTAFVDYDHDYNSSGNRVPAFSLGQLDDAEVARDVALLALGDKLAREIVDFISIAW